MEHLPLLGDLLKAELGGGVAQERHVNQPLDRVRRVAEPVDQLVNQVGAVGLIPDRGDLAVDVQPLGEVFDIIFGDVGFQLDVDEALGRRTDLRRLALFLGDRLGQKPQVHVVPDRLHMPVLAGAEDIAGAADLKVPQRNPEAGTEPGELPDGV